MTTSARTTPKAKEGLGDKASAMVVLRESYEVSEPTIDSHIVKLKSAGADTLVLLRHRQSF